MCTLSSLIAGINTWNSFKSPKHFWNKNKFEVVVISKGHIIDKYSLYGMKYFFTFPESSEHYNCEYLFPSRSEEQ